jgi:Cof subfamily protein (haloacid dehalogenase superfamily)
MDLDGTLLDRRSMVTPRTRAALERAHHAGTAVAVATGRSYALLHYFTDGLPLTGPQITFNGAIVVDPVTGRPIYLQAVPEAWVSPVVAFLRNHDIYSCYYTDSQIFVRGRSPLERALVPPNFPQPIDTDDLEGLIHLPCIKLVAVADPAAISALRPEAEWVFGSHLYVTQTSPMLLEFLHPEVSKGAALQRVIVDLDLAPAQVIAFGDGHNDIGMLQVAGTGVAMANASAEVQAIADLIAPSNSEDGIAAMLDELL